MGKYGSAWLSGRAPIRTRRRAWQVLLVLPVIAAGFANPMRVSAAPTVWNAGDVFAGVGNGSYKVYDNTGVFKETIANGTGSTFTAGCAFNPAVTKLYGTDFTADKVPVFDNAVPHSVVQTIDTSPSGGTSSEDVTFAADGTFYVGHADPNHVLVHYDALGNQMATFSLAVENHGTDWFDLAADQKTMFYTSEGSLVKRFDVGANAQLPDFATLPAGDTGFALRLLPPGDGSGGLLVAGFAHIERLNALGNVVQTYNVPGENNWFALNLDPNGTSFWSGGVLSGNFYRFNIATGAVEVGPIASQPATNLGGLCLKGEPTAATGPPPATCSPEGNAEGHDAAGTVTGRTRLAMATLAEPNASDHPGSSNRDEICVDDDTHTTDVKITGKLTFFLCGPADVTPSGCPVGKGTRVGDPKKVQDDQATKSPAAKGKLTKQTGNYCWRVHFSGDANFLASDETNGTTECFTISAPDSKKQ
jgi:hypothetical protein